MPLRLPWIACLLLALSQPICAAPAAPSDLRSDILYTTRGEFLQVTPMHLLTLNAHIQQFAYEPLGIEVAFAGSEVQGDQTIHFVKTMDVRNGHEMSRLSFTTPTADDLSHLYLIGWSVSGKYVLLLKHFVTDPQKPSQYTYEYLRWDLTANPPVTLTIDPRMHLPVGIKAVERAGFGIPSPTRRWIVFGQDYQIRDEEENDGTAKTDFLCYDVDRDTYRLLNLPPGTQTYSWVDENHLRIEQGENTQQFDVISGKISALQADAPPAALDTSKQYPDLTLDVENRVLENKKEGGGHLASHILWIRRKPVGREPLGVVAAGLTPGREEPLAVWSPTGKQIAFLSQGDLYVTNLIPAPKSAADDLREVDLRPCAEERETAMSNLKQIGLAFIQYAQDNNEKFPPSAGVNETIYPYLKIRELFQVGSHPFVYTLPGGTSLANIQTPSETEIGMIDLPCARVVLFADGHVKVFLKPLSPQE